MSNFEIEYKKYAQDSTPDLWDRIEAGVDAYEASAGNDLTEDNKNVSDIEESLNVEKSSNLENVSDFETHRKKKFNIRKYGGIIAAAACLLIAAPAIMFLSNNSFGNMTASAPAADAAPMVMETAEAPMESEDYEEVATEAAEDTMNSVDFDYEETADMAMAEAASETVAESASEAVAESAVAEEPAEGRTKEAPALNMATAKAANASENSDVFEAEDYAAEETCEVTDAVAEEAEMPNVESEEAYEDVDDSSDAAASKLPVRAMWDSEAGSSKGEVYVLDKNMPQTKVHLFIDRAVTDFKIMKIAINGYSDEEGVIYTSEDLYDVGTLMAGDELIFKMSFPGDLPQYAISFKDSTGKEIVLDISESGRDGSIILSEM